MRLKTKINKEEFDALSDPLKELYKEQNGSYLLDTDEAEELRTANARAREERDEAKRKADEIKARLDALEAERAEEAERRRQEEQENARKNKDVDAIEASWQAKLDEAKRKSEEAEARLRDQLQTLLVDNKAADLAAEISTAPKLILPHIKARLKAELDGGEVKTRVLDADGKPSALTLDDLKQEFLANDEYAAIIKSSKASGGGASNGNGGGGASGKSFNDLSEAERVALHRQNPEKFRQMAEEAGIQFPN